MLSSKLLIITFVCSCSALRLPVNPNLPQSTSTAATESEIAAMESELAAPTVSTVQSGFQNTNFELNVGDLHPKFARLKEKSAGEHAPQILFTHLLKAGGSSVEFMMKDLMFTSDHYENQNVQGDIETKKFNKLSSEEAELNTHSKYFRIGMVRSPCDYLVSIWNFQSSPYGKDTGHGVWPRKCLQKYHKGDITNLYANITKYGPNSILRSVTQKDRFQQWVREVGGEKMHYLTYRFYRALHADPQYLKKSTFDDGQYYTCIKDHSESEQNTIQEALMTTDFSQRYECIIKTESMAEDMKACMHKYAERITHPEVKAKFVEKLEGYKRWNVKVNKRHHAQCSEYFDDQTMAYVWDREGPFAQKMGYNTCCTE